MGWVRDYAIAKLISGNTCMFLRHKLLMAFLAQNGGGSDPQSDLTGTTWLFNATLDLSGAVWPSAGNSDEYNINFTSNSTDYTGIVLTNMGPAMLGISYNASSDSVIPYLTGLMGNGWTDQAYRTISITGGTDATNADLIAWIQANATQL